jgi:hypothetical protein
MRYRLLYLSDFCCQLDILVYWLNQHYLASAEKFVEKSLKLIVNQHLDNISGEENKMKFLSLCEDITKLKFV